MRVFSTPVMILFRTGKNLSAAQVAFMNALGLLKKVCLI